MTLASKIGRRTRPALHRIFGIGLGLVALSGCADGTPPSNAEANRSVLDTLRTLDFAILSSAAQRLNEVDHRRDVTVVHRDAAGDTVGFESLRLTVRDGQIAAIDTSRHLRFRSVRLQQRLGPDVDFRPDSAAFAAIVPSDPPYLSARALDAYDFVRVQQGSLPAIEVRLRDPSEIESDIHRVVLTYDADTRQVVQVEVERRRNSFFVSAKTESMFGLRRLADSLWFPDAYLFRQVQRSPLQKTYDLTRTERFTELAATHR